MANPKYNRMFLLPPYFSSDVPVMDAGIELEFYFMHPRLLPMCPCLSLVFPHPGISDFEQVIKLDQASVSSTINDMPDSSNCCKNKMKRYKWET